MTHMSVTRLSRLRTSFLRVQPQLLSSLDYLQPLLLAFRKLLLQYLLNPVELNRTSLAQSILPLVPSVLHLLTSTSSMTTTSKSVLRSTPPYQSITISYHNVSNTSLHPRRLSLWNVRHLSWIDHVHHVNQIPFSI